MGAGVAMGSGLQEEELQLRPAFEIPARDEVW